MSTPDKNFDINAPLPPPIMGTGKTKKLKGGIKDGKFELSDTGGVPWNGKYKNLKDQQIFSSKLEKLKQNHKGTYFYNYYLKDVDDLIRQYTLCYNDGKEVLNTYKNENKDKYWDQMLRDNGSVLGLPDSVLSPDEKELFLTFPEINQLELVRQAAIRQRYIDQTQSLNLSFDPQDSPKWINQVHMEAHKLGIKTLYYLRTDSVIKGDLGSRQAECVSCDG
jgi:hypothetical protein